MAKEGYSEGSREGDGSTQVHQQQAGRLSARGSARSETTPRLPAPVRVSSSQWCRIGLAQVPVSKNASMSSTCSEVARIRERLLGVIPNSHIIRCSAAEHACAI